MLFIECNAVVVVNQKVVEYMGDIMAAPETAERQIEVLSKFQFVAGWYYNMQATWKWS